MQPDDALQAHCKDVIIISACMLFLTLVSGSLRAYVRIRLLKFVGWDDWAMVLAMLCYIASSVTICLTAAALLRFDQGSPIFSYPLFLKIARTGFCTYLVTIISIKISIAIFMWRIFGPLHPKKRIAVVVCTAIPSIVGLILVIMTIFTCSYRYTDEMDDICNCSRAFDIVNQVFSITSCVSNWYFALQAIYILWHMTMTRLAFISTIFLFAVGAIGDVASIMRILSFYQGSTSTLRQLQYTQWSIIEAGACATAACLFTLRPLFRNGFADRLGNKFFMPHSGPAVLIGTPVIEDRNVASLRTHGLAGETTTSRQDSFFPGGRKRAGSIFTFLSFGLTTTRESDSEA